MNNDFSYSLGIRMEMIIFIMVWRCWPSNTLYTFLMEKTIPTCDICWCCQSLQFFSLPNVVIHTFKHWVGLFIYFAQSWVHFTSMDIALVGSCAIGNAKFVNKNRMQVGNCMLNCHNSTLNCWCCSHSISHTSRLYVGILELVGWGPCRGVWSFGLVVSLQIKIQSCLRFIPGQRILNCHDFWSHLAPSSLFSCEAWRIYLCSATRKIYCEAVLSQNRQI